MSCLKISSVGPTDRLKFDPGFHRAENSAPHSSVARGRWYVVPENSNTTGFRLSVATFRFHWYPDGMSASGPPRV